jgi:hypothetical protein
MPDWKEIVRERLAGIGFDGAYEAQIVDEMAQQLEDRYDELRAAGTPEGDAHRLVREELKSERLVEDLRKARTALRQPPALGSPPPRRGFLSGFRHDLKTALRAIRLNTAFSLMVIGMLALAIAGNAAIFSIFNGLFLKPLPFPIPGDWSIWTKPRPSGISNLSEFPPRIFTAGEKTIPRSTAWRSSTTRTLTCRALVQHSASTVPRAPTICSTFCV